MNLEGYTVQQWQHRIENLPQRIQTIVYHKLSLHINGQSSLGVMEYLEAKAMYPGYWNKNNEFDPFFENRKA